MKLLILVLLLSVIGSESATAPVLPDFDYSPFELADNVLPLNLSETFEDYALFPIPPEIPFLEEKNMSTATPPSGANETVKALPGVYSVIRIIPRTLAELNFTRNLHGNATKYDLDFWKGPKKLGFHVDVMVPPNTRRQIIRMLRRSKIEWEFIIPNVETKIFESEKKSRGDGFGDKILRDSVSGASYFNFREYQSYETTRRYLRSVEFAFPRLARVYTIGTSHEGRPIEVIKIGMPVTDDTKRIIWIDGGMHAREWAAPHVATYLIYRLTANYDRDPAIRNILNTFNFFIAPNVNPDGYEYSRSASHPVVRLWRKNRSPSVCPQPQLCCSGVDLNRNFDIEWGKVGSSPHPCSGIFHGKVAFSEPESRAVRDVVWGRRHQIDAFVTLHTYAQMWTHPYGFIRARYPTNIGELQSIGRKSVAALKRVHGTQYVVGSSADLLYASAGGSDDWSNVKAGIRYVYLLEMRPDQYHKDGFILPENQLLPTGQETFAGIMTMVLEIMKNNNLGASILPPVPIAVAPSPITRASTPGLRRHLQRPTSNIRSTNIVGPIGRTRITRPRAIVPNKVGVCDDVPNPFARQWTCRQQKGWGWCGTKFMAGFCRKSCGVCRGGPPEPCDDRAPLGQHTCKEYKKWGMCRKPFMFGFCELTCGTCEASRFFPSSSFTSLG